MAEEINNKTLLTKKNESIQLVGPSSSFKFSYDFSLFFSQEQNWVLIDHRIFYYQLKDYVLVHNELAK